MSSDTSKTLARWSCTGVVLGQPLARLQVTPDEVMYNIHEAEDAEDDDAGGLVFTRLGKLGDLNMVDIEGIADLKLGKGGTQLWLFDSMDDPLVLDPGAVINKGKDVRPYLHRNCNEVPWVHLPRSCIAARAARHSSCQRVSSRASSGTS